MSRPEAARRRRARELGIAVGSGQPGPLNAITDVSGVRVGHTTLVEGDGPLQVGRGPIRTGVTVVLPHAGDAFIEPVYAGHSWLNGDGELTGTAWIEELGTLCSPIALTNTASAGVVRDALVQAEIRAHPRQMWSLPVVGETWDALLNDINGQHVRPEHVLAAYDGASSGPVEEGSVGGGTGMISFGFKAGIGTASRQLPADDGGWTIGALVQSNFGERERFSVLGVPVGAVLDEREVPLPGVPRHLLGAGSIITLIATDAPLTHRQCVRVAKRAGLALGRLGGTGENGSGEGTLVWSTAARKVIPSGDYERDGTFSYAVDVLNDAYIDAVFAAAIEAVEEAVLNALLAAETMTGINSTVAHALPPARLVEVLREHGRALRDVT